MALMKEELGLSLDNFVWETWSNVGSQQKEQTFKEYRERSHKLAQIYEREVEQGCEGSWQAEVMIKPKL